MQLLRSPPSGEPMTASDHELAVLLATAAGRLLMEVRAGGLTGSDLKDAGDRSLHEFLVRSLAEQRPTDAVLSEEGADDYARSAHGRVWIIGPLDGSRESSELPRTDWAVQRGAGGRRLRRRRRSGLPGPRDHLVDGYAASGPQHSRSSALHPRQPGPVPRHMLDGWPTASEVSSSRWAQPVPRPVPTKVERDELK